MERTWWENALDALREQVKQLNEENKKLKELVRKYEQKG